MRNSEVSKAGLMGRWALLASVILVALALNPTSQTATVKNGGTTPINPAVASPLTSAGKMILPESSAFAERAIELGGTGPVVPGLPSSFEQRPAPLGAAQAGSLSGGLVASLASPPALLPAGPGCTDADFTPAATSPEVAGDIAYSVAVGDFNLDGRPDLATANAGDDNVTILLGDGTGNFTAAATSPEVVGDSPYSVAVGDFNLDGRPDLATANLVSFNVTILLGDGTGNFTEAGTSPAGLGHAPHSVTVGDFNLDGRPDLAMAHPDDSKVTILLGDGTGNFTQPATSPEGVVDGPSFVAVGDFNLDGRPDLATANVGSNNVAILLGDGTGNFTAAATSPEGAGDRPFSVAVGDFNLDGRPDLATLNLASANVTILLGDGTGNFTAPPTSPEGAGNGPISVALGDFNLDGRPDLATANHFEHNVTILLGDGTGDFTAAATSPEGAGTRPVSVAVGDFNLDGRPDLATANSGSNNVTILLNSCALQACPTDFSPPATSPEAAGSVPVSVAVGDFNLDGRADLATANFSANNVTILLGNGTGEFTEPGTSPEGAGTQPTSVAVGDFDLDGRPDLATANQNSDNVTILLGGGTGNFTAPATSPEGAGNGPLSVAVGDFDLDGRPDLATANQHSNNVTILLGDGTGNFTAAATSPEGAGGFPVSVAVGDFNLDGRPDLATANLFADTVTILLGDGTGDFTASPTSPKGAGTGPVSVGVGDFNLDGRPDLATANLFADTVTILLGDGTGDFTAPDTSPEGAGGQPESVAVGDFNLDGRPDLATANRFSNNVTILLGDGTGNFTAPPTSPEGAEDGPRSVAVGDFNLDGRPDLATANSGSNNVTILLGGCASPANVFGTKTKSGGNTPGSTVTYTVELSNSSTSAQLDNSGHEFTDALPSQLTLVSASATSGTATTAANTVNWNGTIAGSGSVTITITATINSVPDGTTVSNQGTINYDADGNDTNETSRFTDDPAVPGASNPTTFTVNDVNDPPDAVNDVLSSVAEDSSQRTIPIASLLANDTTGPANESGQTLTFSLVEGSGAGGTVSSDATNVYFTPAANFNGAASFQYMVTDNGTTHGAPDPKSDTATVSFTITEVNDAPAAVNDALSSVAEDSPQRTIPIASLLGNDQKGPANESGQTLTLALVPGSAVGGTISSDATNVYFTPAAGFNGPASFQYTVTDNGTTNGAADPLTSAPATVSFTITESNDAPVAVNDTLTNIAEDSAPRSIPFADLTGNDSKGAANESGQTLTIITADNAVGGNVTLVPGFVVFTPAENYNGPASFDYIVEDNGTTNGVADPKTSGAASVQFNITEVNDFPTAVADTLGNVAEDSGERTITFAELTGNDSKGAANESGQTLIVKTVSSPVGVTVSIVGGTVRVTPLPDFNGAASFQYTAEDNGTTNGFLEQRPSGPALVQFTITEVNDAPTAVNDTLTNVAEDSGERTIPFADLTGNDGKGPANENGQTVIVKTVSNPVGGTVSIVAGNVVFTPAANFNGPAGFDYTVEDNGTTNGVSAPLTSGTATASFNITPQADAPSVTNAVTNANTQTTSGLVISRNPADGPEVTHSRITGITDGTLFKNNGTTPINNGDFITFAEGNAGLKFTPGTADGSFTVQASTSASDAGLGGGTATATITVNPLGGVIRFSAGSYNVDEAAGFSTITVERTGDTSQAVTVDYASSDLSNPADFIPCSSPGAGFASSRCDFTTAIGTLHFAAGETSQTFNVLISQDNYLEGPETLDLTLSNPTGGAVLGVPATANLGITDDTTEGLTNPIDVSSDFVRALYHDILNREPDGPGLAFWTDNIEKCNDPARLPAGQTVAQCIDKQRESTAVAFFEAPEFQITGGFVYRLYKGSLTGAPNYDGGSPGRFPTFLEFIKDVSQVSEGIVVNNQISGAVVEANRNQLVAEFVQRPEFIAKYGGLNNTLYVDELFNTTTITPTPAEKQALVDGLTNGTETRASVLRKVVDGTVVIDEGNVQFTTTYGQAFYNQEFRRVFVFMEFVGFLRRNPDAAGFVFWLGKLNQFNGDPFQAEMVRAFILSPEYRSRFGQ